MKFTSITTFVYPVLSFLFLAVFAAPLASRDVTDVFVPQILYPTKGTVWIVGERQHVTWNVSNPPAEITNKIGEIHLRQNGATSQSTLASNFNILLGKIEVTVPQVENGDDYQIVLFGDSGNFSPKFTIKNHY